SFAHAPAQAFTLTRVANNSPVTFTAAVDNTSGHTVVTIAGFGGANADHASLADGVYQLAVLPLEVYNASGVLDGKGDGVSGDAYFTPSTGAGRIHRLFGDADGDADVDAIDFGSFRGAYGTSNNVFDSDADGDVDAVDFGQFRQRFGTSV